MSIDMWGGVECTINRVHDDYFDQCERAGRRLDDFDRFAELGLRALRMPVLWEHGDWAWADASLQRVRDLGMRPIVGLLHHGSGPPHTSLVDPKFPALFAEYAATCAQRYPWVQQWTPVNEPLTTARFSALYGHWYPHLRDKTAFLKALLHQCVATARAMRAIRTVNPDAELITTEDVGTISSTRPLTYQADYENARRWLSLDLLMGHVRPGHPFYRHLRGPLLDELCESPCPPNIIGVNYYATSDRFLDHRLHLYPEALHGGNGRDRYVDTETVRVEGGDRPSHLRTLSLVWERYRRPVALTEVHLGCTVDEQLRWFKQAYDAALTLRSRGADVRAVTAWALLGSFDWDSLVTLRRDHYEPGVYDLRSGEPTALAGLVNALATGRPAPRIEGMGWWMREPRPLGVAS